MPTPPPYSFRPVTDADDEWLYRLNAATMRAYAEQTYGPWDEAIARRIFAERWERSAMKIVVVGGEDAGLFDVRPHADGVEVAQIKILPAFQGRGLGTHILTDVLADAHSQGLSVALRVLRVNPARRLYERLGFVAIGATATHHVMVAPPDFAKRR